MGLLSLFLGVTMWASHGSAAVMRVRSLRRSSGFPKPALRFSFSADVSKESLYWPEEPRAQSELLKVAIDANRRAVAIEEYAMPGSQGPTNAVLMDLTSCRRTETMGFFDKFVCFTFDMGDPDEPLKEEEAKVGFANAVNDALGVPLQLYDVADRFEGWHTEAAGDCGVWSAVQSSLLQLPAEELDETAQTWEIPLSVMDMVRSAAGQLLLESSVSFCTDSQGQLLAANLSRTVSLVHKNKSAEIIRTVVTRTHLSNMKMLASNASAFAPQRRAQGGRCVDLTSKMAAQRQLHVGLNDLDRLERTNAEAGGAWRAEAYHKWEGLHIADLTRRLGAHMKLLTLPLRQSPLPCGKLRNRNCVFGSRPKPRLPKSFDARQRWPHCPSIRTASNQGACGSCWAVAAAATLSDRFCIAVELQNHSDSRLLNLTLSSQELLDCDRRPAGGCGGGQLDDAWRFLQSTGLPRESCVPYLHCPDPLDSQCGLASKLDKVDVELDSSQEKCKLDSCSNGQPMQFYKAGHVYAVSPPGDTQGMRQEIFSVGPIEVAFFVFSDFHSYSNGTYFRTPSAFGPLGGHAVRAIGWGLDSHTTEYWLVANSWGEAWGMKGFFRIRRGMNECGIETMPAAGIPELP